jgi:YtkA-like
MRTLTIVAATAVALAAAGAAQAGCWATAGVSPPPPETAGATWNADIKVMQHGRTPLADAKPTVTIRNASGESKTFAARPTGETGVYRAKVVFPSAGTWRYAVHDGFPVRECAQTHTFAPVDIGAPPGSGTPLAWTISGSIALGLALTALLVAGLRPRRRGALVAATTR